MNNETVMTKENFFYWLDGYLYDRKTLDEHAVSKIKYQMMQAGLLLNPQNDTDIAKGQADGCNG